MLNDLLRPGESLRDALDWYAKTLLTLALREAGWNKTAVCRRLKMPRQSVYNAMMRFGIPMERPKGRRS